MHDAPANQAAGVYSLCTGLSDDADVLSPTSSQWYVLEASVASFEIFVMQELNLSFDICLGLDSTSTND